MASNAILSVPLVTPISHSSDFPLSSPIPSHFPLLDGNLADAPDPNRVSPEVSLLGLLAKDSLSKKKGRKKATTSSSPARGGKK